MIVELAELRIDANVPRSIPCMRDGVWERDYAPPVRFPLLFNLVKHTSLIFPSFSLCRVPMLASLLWR